MIKVLLAQGHGAGKAHNRGGICFNEGDNNYLYSLILKEELETYDGVQVDLLRKDINDNPSLEERSKAGAGYDLYYAIHSNAVTDKPNVRGTEVWDSVERPNIALAKLICEVTSEFFEHSNRGVKYKEGQPGYNWYAELRFNQAKSAMIVENGFHTNLEDCSIFKNCHREIGIAQARAIASHYGLKKKVIKEKPHWGEDVYQRLVNKDIKFDEKRFNDKLTRAEAFAIVDKLTDWIKVKLKGVI